MVRLIFLLLLLFGLIPTALYLLAPSLVGAIADKIYANARIPERREPPLTAYAIPQSGGDVQVIGGRGEELSCSLPNFLNYVVFRDQKQPISLQMRQACITHDYCYRHGSATYGYSQEDCDYRLLNDAMRLCMFIAKVNRESIDDRESIDECRQQAKKILLGVRVFGSGLFKSVHDIESQHGENNVLPGFKAPTYPDIKASTYFDYDPFPTLARSYRAYRIADTPGQSSGRKSLYSFLVKPAGLAMTIHLNADENTLSNDSVCHEYQLPTTSKWLTNAPIVVRRKTGDANDMEDWFVWFQRLSLDNTGSRFLAIAPARATLTDWQRIFPGLKPDCNPAKPNILKQVSLNHDLRNRIVGPLASIVFLTGFVSSDHHQNATSEFHSAPGLEPEDGSLKLMSLRTNECNGEYPVLCFSDFSLMINHLGRYRTYWNGSFWNYQEPLRSRDAHNKMGLAEKGDTTEPQRYRNFMSPPILMAGPDKPPLIAWLRRGREDNGNDYEKGAELRRMARFVPGVDQTDPVTGGNVGNLYLNGLTEKREPLVIFGRTSKMPRLYSFSANVDTDKIDIFYWTLLEPQAAILGEEENQGMDSYQVQDVSREQIKESCDKGLDPSWMFRPPVVLSNDDGSADIVFSRVNSQSTGQVPPTLEVLHLLISANNTCAKVGEEELDQIVFPEIKEQKAIIIKETYYSLLRKTPLIAWREPKQRAISLVLPFNEQPYWFLLNSDRS